jgi:hypothetical protein
MRNPWLELNGNATRGWALDQDRPFIEAYNGAVLEWRRGSEDKKSDVRIRTSLLPEPFFGRWDAPVVMLLQNPGVDEQVDERLHRSDVSFRRRLLEAIRDGKSEHFHLSYPQDTPGRKWWRTRTRNLGAPEDMARSLLALQFFPYHSKKFDHGQIRVPSQEFTFDLVRGAMRRGARIVLARGVSCWLGALPELASYERVVRFTNPLYVGFSANENDDCGVDWQGRPVSLETLRAEVRR